MIIALNGYAKVGKDEIANIIRSLHPIWEVKKFAGKLKQVATLLTGITDLENQSTKASSLGPEWGNMTVRDLLQRLGTDAVRDGLHPDAWVNALMADYKTESFSGYIGDTRFDIDASHWIITDCRFPNEAKAVKRFGGKVIRVNRTGIGPVNNHLSETALDNWNFDAVIENDGTLQDLKYKSISIL